MKKCTGVFEKVRGSGIWWVRYRDEGGRIHRRLSGRSRNDAVDFRERCREEVRQRKYFPERFRKAPVRFAEIAKDALEYGDRHKRSYLDDRSRMRLLREWFGNREAESITTHEIEDKLHAVAEERGWAAGTHNRYRALLSLTYRLAKRNGKVSASPVREVPHRRESNNRVRYLTRGKGSEDERLTRAIREGWPEHLPEYIFSKNTGLRLGSQYSATYEMIDWSRMELDIPRTKNEEPVHVPLNADVLAALRMLPSWEQRSGLIFRSAESGQGFKGNRHWFKPALRQAGIANFHWHDLRHTFASWLVQDGVPLERVSRYLGHKSLNMSMRYAHLAPNQAHQDFARLVEKSTKTSTDHLPAGSDNV